MMDRAMPHFVKSHGLGNDYLVIDPRDVPFTVTPEAARLICDRHRGVGADGILVVAEPRGADFGVRILNPDGSEAEKSGNGIRILAKYLREHGHTAADTFAIDTAGGRVDVALTMVDGRVHEVTADMGAARFGALEEIEVDGRRVPVSVVDIGNPHCVVVVDDGSPGTAHDRAAIDPRTLGPQIERHPAFPARTNVQFARVVTRSRLRVEIWERGAGYTLASGTSSCAAAAACHRRGLVDREVTVAMPGGDLAVTVGDGYAMRLRGPVEEVMSGDFGGELLARLVRAAAAG